MKIKAVGAYSAKQPLEPMDITRREPGPHDVKIEIAYCGVCHSDLHQSVRSGRGRFTPACRVMKLWGAW